MQRFQHSLAGPYISLNKNSVRNSATPYKIWKIAKQQRSHLWQAFHVQCLSSFLFLYFACLSPIVAFGALLGKATENRIATIESLMSGVKREEAISLLILYCTVQQKWMLIFPAYLVSCLNQFQAWLAESCSDYFPANLWSSSAQLDQSTFSRKSSTRSARNRLAQWLKLFIESSIT